MQKRWKTKKKFKSYLKRMFQLYLIYSILYYGEGNLTEEYCLPFLIWSFYFAIIYLKSAQEQKAHNKRIHSLFYGITFMVCALTRITNAIPLCIVIIIGLLVMVLEKQWRDIITNAFFSDG